jgi:hypothetical protein
MKSTIFVIIAIIVVLLGFWYINVPDEVIPDIPDQNTNIVLSIEEDIEGAARDIEALAFDFDDNTPFVVRRVWVQDENFYFEYENTNGTLGQLLVVRQEEGYKGIGYFAPSESGWVLQAGEGELLGAQAQLYRLNDEGMWIRVN